MTFTITYRGTDGALKKTSIEAMSRTECAAQCRARGVTPISIAEDKKAKPSASASNWCPAESPQSAGGRPNGNTHPLSRLPLWAAIVVIAFAASVGIWWLLRPRGSTDWTPASPSPCPTNTNGVASHSNAKTSAVPTSVCNRNVQPQVSNPQPSPPPSDPYGGVWRGQKIVSYTASTNGWSTYERIVTADGKSHGIVGSTVKPLFDNASDQMLALAVRSTQEGEMPPMPLSPMLEHDFMESLKKEIVIKDDDSEDIKQIKRDVIAAREDMLTMVGNGMTVEQALAEHFKLSNENAGIRAQAVEELRKILDSGDREGAEKYMETVNASLEKMGIMKLELPEERVRGRKWRERTEEKD